MLFNSPEFIFLFLPISIIGFSLIARQAGRSAAIGWLVFSSLFFYGWWNPSFVTLIVFSILFNYALGLFIGSPRPRLFRKAVMSLGIFVNLALIGYFKYGAFFAENASFLSGEPISVEQVVLPLGISFFTFQQITYLIDSYRGGTREFNFLNYCLFVTFFPQLIAGPIVHHSEMLPQFHRPEIFRLHWRNLAIGITLFSIGLFKKAVLADGIAVYATPVFDAAAQGERIAFFEAWSGALAYTFQLYFDFSGYSDMALGAARMFGIRLPMNFFSPYKATSIIDFWRRWHITLSRFLRDYLYVPLGGNRRGRPRRYANLLVTMLLGGLWHGAGWTFVIWGGLHGLYLISNHAWRAIWRIAGNHRLLPAWLQRALSWAVTFLAVVVAWIFFRATSFEAAFNMLEGIAGLNGVSIPAGIMVRLGPIGTALEDLGATRSLEGGGDFMMAYLWIASLLTVTLALPNSIELLARYRPVFDLDRVGRIIEHRLARRRLQWKLSPGWAVLTACIAAGGLLSLTQVSEFLYYQF